MQTAKYCKPALTSFFLFCFAFKKKPKSDQLQYLFPLYCSRKGPYQQVSLHLILISTLEVTNIEPSLVWPRHPHKFSYSLWLNQLRVCYVCVTGVSVFQDNCIVTSLRCYMLELMMVLEELEITDENAECIADFRKQLPEEHFVSPAHCLPSRFV